MSSGSESEYKVCGVGTSDVEEFEESCFFEAINILLQNSGKDYHHVLWDVYIRPSFISWRQKASIAQISRLLRWPDTIDACG
jgi:hypothetical protein